jgi:Skp family chaperone for outer membrane proteins
VKRTITLALGILALGVAAYWGGQLSAQANNQPAPASLLRNKIAVFNMSKVIKEYKRWQDFEAQRKSALDAQEAKFNKIKGDMTKKTEELQKLPPSETAKREQLERELRLLKNQGAEMQEDVQKQFAKWEQDQVTTIYKEIETLCADMARTYHIELILHYTDPSKDEEKYHPMNLARKLQSSGITPIYMAQGMDISQWVLDNLNKRYGASAAAAPAGAGGTGKQP